MSKLQHEKHLNLNPENIEQRIQVDLTPDNQLQFIHLVQQHIEPLDPIRACQIYVSIHEKLNNISALLESLDRGISRSQQHYAQQRDLRDPAVSAFWFQKIELLNQRADADHSELLDTLDRGLDRFLAQHPAQYLVLAEIADRHQAYVLLERVLIKLLDLEHESGPVLQGLIKYYARSQQIIDQGHDTVEMRRFQILMQMIYAQALNLEPITFYHSSLACIHAFPKSAMGYHFAGIYLAGQGQYERALDYLKRALTIKVDVVTWRCWIESRYCLGHEPDLEVPVFSDAFPVILFAESYHFEDFILREVRDEDQPGWFDMSAEMYRQAYAAYRAYHLDDRFESVANAEREYLGKCCNHYAMRLNQLGKHHLAAEVATEGLRLSGLVELHATRVDALMCLQDVQAADQALTEYFGTYSAEDVPFLQHQAHLASQLRVDFELGRLQGLEDKAHTQLIQLYQFEVQQREKHKKVIKQQQLLTEQDHLLDSVLGHIEHTIDDLMLKHDIQKRIAYYENIVLEHAHVATPYYMLMFDYHTLENHEKTKYYALTFLQRKPRELSQEHQKNQAHFHLIKSYFLLGEYRAAVQHFSQHDDEIVQSMPDSEYTELQVYLIQSYIHLNQAQQVQRHIESVQEMYRSKAWPYDALMANVDLSHAEFLYAQGQLKSAHQHLKRVLAFPEHNRKALIFNKTWKKPSFWQRLF